MSEVGQQPPLPSTDEQAKVEQIEKPTSRKGLMAELPGGVQVAGYALDNGGFQWMFVNKAGIKTVVMLSEAATSAMAQIAEELLNPGTMEAA